MENPPVTSEEIVAVPKSHETVIDQNRENQADKTLDNTRLPVSQESTASSEQHHSDTENLLNRPAISLKKHIEGHSDITKDKTLELIIFSPGDMNATTATVSINGMKYETDVKDGWGECTVGVRLEDGKYEV